jgi:hypothetical protein
MALQASPGRRSRPRAMRVGNSRRAVTQTNPSQSTLTRARGTVHKFIFAGRVDGVDAPKYARETKNRASLSARRRNPANRRSRARAYFYQNPVLGASFGIKIINAITTGAGFRLSLRGPENRVDFRVRIKQERVRLYQAFRAFPTRRSRARAYWGQNTPSRGIS